MRPGDIAPDPRDPLPAGRAAEEQVAALYRVLGYEVRRDILLDGNQIDVFAQQRIPLLGLVRVCVEVKDHPSRPIPISEVRAFANVGNLLLSAGKCEQAHLVTTGTISRNSRSAVEPFTALKLLTYSDLERQVFEPEIALGHWLQTYRQSPINLVYVDLQTTLLDFTAGRSVTAPGRLCASQLLDVAVEHPHRGVIIFGDYGAGKTTLLHRIKAAAIERRMIDETSAVPLLVPLRNLTDGMDTEQLALQALRSELGLSLPPTTFWNLLESGRFLVLLDGFDEVTLRADARRRAELLALVSPLLFGVSPAIITSRPSYFASTAEYREALRIMRTGGRPPLQGRSGDPGAQRLDTFTSRLSDRYIDSGPLSARDAQYISYRLDPLTSAQIDEYLQHVAPQIEAVGGANPEEVRAFLDGVYDLSDLITRPIILDMAVASIIDGHINPKDKTLANGPAGLYEAYARVKLDVDWRKAASRRELLSYDQRMQFAEQCALEMFREDTLTIGQDDLVRLVRRVVPTSDAAPFDEVLTDLRTCSFLTVDGEGGLQFIHRSYQEFFLARLIRRELQDRSTRNLISPLRWEYTYFLGAFAFTDNDFYNTLLELARGSTPGDSSTILQHTVVTGDNAAQAVLSARESATSLSWTGRTIGKMKRPRVAIRRSVLTRVEMESITLEELEFVDSELNVTLTGASVDRMTATLCTGSIEVRGKIGMVSLTGGDLTVTDRSTARSVIANDMRLNLTITKDGPREVKCGTVTGRLGLRDANVVSVDHCQVHVDVPRGHVIGTINNSIVEVPLTSFDNLTTRIVSSALVVRGKRPEIRNVGEIRRQPNRVLAGDGAVGNGSIVILGPSIPLDAWWSHQLNMLTFGGGLMELQVEWLGVTVNRKALPIQGQRDSFVHVRHEGALAFVIEGRGEALRRTANGVQSLVDLVTMENLCAPRWFTSRIRRLLVELGGPHDAIEELIEVTERRLNLLGGAQGNGVLV